MEEQIEQKDILIEKLKQQANQDEDLEERNEELVTKLREKGAAIDGLNQANISAMEDIASLTVFNEKYKKLLEVQENKIKFLEK